MAKIKSRQDAPQTIFSGRRALWGYYDSNGPAVLFCLEEIAGARDYQLSITDCRKPDYGTTLIGAATLPTRLPNESRTTKRTVYSPGGSWRPLRYVMPWCWICSKPSGLRWL